MFVNNLLKQFLVKTLIKLVNHNNLLNNVLVKLIKEHGNQLKLNYTFK